MIANEESSPAAVELLLVSRRFGERTILDGVSLGVGRGEFFALVGPSGSGKSTLLKMVSGLDVPDSGRVCLSGRDVTAVPPYRRPVHTVFQNYSLFPHLNVEDNVGFPLRVAGVPRNERRDRVRKALSWVQLETFAARRIAGLSGGERQRVAVARALVDEPECVLLDEPLSALDPHLRGQTLELLQEIQDRLQVTYLYVTHDREEALRAAHRLGVLHEGRLQQVGRPEEVYHQPANAFVASFIGPINWFAAEITSQDHQPAARLTSGHLVHLDGQKLPDGRDVLLGVRPEALRVGAESGLPVRVVQRQFAGASVSLGLEMDGGIRLIATVAADGPVPAVGATCRVGWPPRATHLFPAETRDRT